jgi:hypothetical protein
MATTNMRYDHQRYTNVASLPLGLCQPSGSVPRISTWAGWGYYGLEASDKVILQSKEPMAMHAREPLQACVDDVKLIVVIQRLFNHLQFTPAMWTGFDHY